MLPVAAGVLVMVLAAFFALVGTGAGHGWMRPIMVTIFLFPIWPVAFWLAARRRGAVGWLDAVLAVIFVALSAVPLWQLLVDDFATRDGYYQPVGMPWFFIVVILGGTLAGLAWFARQGIRRALLPVLLLGIGLMVDLGLIWQAQYGPGPWGYNGAEPDVAWFFIWASWQIAVGYALLREADPVPEVDDSFA